MFIKFESEITSSDFISIVVLSYKRYDMTKALVDSIHKHADMPFELIIHDDASGGEVPKQIFEELRGKTSSLIFSGGTMNMGLAASFERGTALASSEYVLMLNNDAIMVGPGLRDIVNVIKTPYVGVFGPWQVGSGVAPAHVCVESNGCRFHLSALCGSGSVMAFRKAVWQDIGGFPHAFCGAADTAFMRKALKAGYWSALRLIREQETFDNVDYHTGCSRSTIGSNEFDLSYPNLFGVANLAEKSKKYCDTRCRLVENVWAKEEAGISNDGWWHDYYVNAVIQGENRFDWTKLPYHQKWQEMVERDRVKV